MSLEIQANGTYGKLARPLAAGVGRTFFLVPASNAFIPAYQQQYPTGDEGQARVAQTLSAAFDLVTTGRGDKILAHPGAHTVTANIALTKSNWTLEGLGPMGSCVITTSTADTLTLTGDNWAIRNMGFVAATTLSCIVLTGCDNWIIEDCNFLTTVGGAGTYFIEMVTTANTLGKINNCRFSANLTVSGATQTMTAMIQGLGNRIDIMNSSFDARRASTDNNGVVTAGVIYAAAADWGNRIFNCSFIEHNGATFTAGINYGTTVTDGGVLQFNNTFLLGTAANAVVNGANSAGFGSNVANGTV